MTPAARAKPLVRVVHTLPYPAAPGLESKSWSHSQSSLSPSALVWFKVSFVVTNKGNSMTPFQYIPTGEAIELPFAEGWAQYEMAVRLQEAASAAP